MLWGGVQGAAQCCVTGAAFEEVMQQGEPALVHTLMNSVAVFARMRSHQKGQAMHLLGRKGLYRTAHGHQQHIPVSMLPLSFTGGMLV